MKTFILSTLAGFVLAVFYVLAAVSGFLVLVSSLLWTLFVALWRTR